MIKSPSILKGSFICLACVDVEFQIVKINVAFPYTIVTDYSRILVYLVDLFLKAMFLQVLFFLLNEYLIGLEEMQYFEEERSEEEISTKLHISKYSPTMIS